MSKRASILTNCGTTVAAVTGINQVEAGKWSEVDLADLSLPVAFIIFGTDERSPPPVGYEQFWVPAVVEVFCKDTDMETLLAAIHTAMLEDPTRGGYALQTIRETCDPFAVDPTRGLAGFDLTFKIQYRHPVGQP
jgi:hypothetical protein